MRTVKNILKDAVTVNDLFTVPEPSPEVVKVFRRARRRLPDLDAIIVIGLKSETASRGRNRLYLAASNLEIHCALALLGMGQVNLEDKLRSVLDRE